MEHLNSQKTEADKLRRQLSEATKALVHSNLEVSYKLEECIAEERRHAAEDRQNLLSQITSLVADAGQKQDARWSTRVSTARSTMATSQSDFTAAEKQYSDSMDGWSKKENLLVEGVLKSRESLKTKMKRDWTVSYVAHETKVILMYKRRLSMTTTTPSRKPLNPSMKRLFA